MSIEENKAAADDQVAPDFIDHAAPPGTPRGPGMAKQAASSFETAIKEAAD